MIPDWQAIARGGESEGAASSAVTLIVFSDFQCPYCRSFAAVVDSIHTNFPNIRIVERSFPLTSIHPRALDAAVAGACAGSTGKYWSFRHIIFNIPDLAQVTSWATPAREAGVTDIARFARCLAHRESISRVIADTLEAARLKLHATPSVILNGRMFAVPPTYTALANRIRGIYPDTL
jgi:protein-disulfide isomerase